FGVAVTGRAGGALMLAGTLVTLLGGSWPLVLAGRAVAGAGGGFLLVSALKVGTGPLAWQHAGWHWIEPPTGWDRGFGKRADAVLRYTTTHPRLHVHDAFIEVDRGTKEPGRLAGQLGRYGRLFGAPTGWRSLYREFPQVLVI